MKKYIVAGLLVWFPVAVTVWVLLWVFGLMDGLFGWMLSGAGAVLPPSARPILEQLRGVPGLGLLVMVLAVLFTGMLAANIAGQWALRQWNRALNKIPIVKSIYNSVKQVSDTLFSSTGNAFREAVLVQYPRAGSWTIAFVTGAPGGEVKRHLVGDYISVYVPTTPNPTSGFFLMMPRADVIALNMSVDTALKYVISMGVVVPGMPTTPMPVADTPTPRN